MRWRRSTATPTRNTPTGRARTSGERRRERSPSQKGRSSLMAARYRVGIIAGGLIAQGAHLRAYRAIPSVEVVAVTDLSEEVRHKWIDELGVPHAYATAEAMLAQEQPDVVSICTWPPLRPEMVELACAHGVKGILCEKPMAVDPGGWASSSGNRRTPATATISRAGCSRWCNSRGAPAPRSRVASPAAPAAPAPAGGAPPSTGRRGS